MIKRRTFVTWMTAVFAIPLLFAGWAAAATVTLNWDYDAGEQGNIQGYRIYYGTVSHAGVTDPVDLVNPDPYANRIEIADPAARSHTIPLPPGTHYFRMTAYGTIDGNPGDSIFSEEVSGQIGILEPINLSIIITYP